MGAFFLQKKAVFLEIFLLYSCNPQKCKQAIIYNLSSCFPFLYPWRMVGMETLKAYIWLGNTWHVSRPRGHDGAVACQWSSPPWLAFWIPPAGGTYIVGGPISFIKNYGLYLKACEKQNVREAPWQVKKPIIWHTENHMCFVVPPGLSRKQFFIWCIGHGVSPPEPFKAEEAQPCTATAVCLGGAEGTLIYTSCMHQRIYLHWNYFMLQQFV